MTEPIKKLELLIPKRILKSQRGFLTLQICDFTNIQILVIGEHVYAFTGTVEEAQNAIMLQYNSLIRKEIDRAENNNKHEDNQQGDKQVQNQPQDGQPPQADARVG